MVGGIDHADEEAADHGGALGGQGGDGGVQLADHAADALGLGLPSHEPQPRHPYNVLFDDDWFLMVRHQVAAFMERRGLGGLIRGGR